MAQENCSFGIKKIVDCKAEGGKQFYKVKWEATWEPAEALVTCQHLIDEFWSFINNKKAKEATAMQEKYKNEMLNTNISNIQRLSEESKDSIENMIQRANGHRIEHLELRSPAEILAQNNHIASVKSDALKSRNPKPLKLEYEVNGKEKTTAGKSTSSPSNANTSGMKYLENFTNPYVKLIIVCKTCNKEQSKFPHNWKRHYFLSHAKNEEKPHKCEYCDERFTILDSMRKHQRKKHPNENTAATSNLQSTSQLDTSNSIFVPKQEMILPKCSPIQETGMLPNGSSEDSYY